MSAFGLPRMWSSSATARIASPAVCFCALSRTGAFFPSRALCGRASPPFDRKIAPAIKRPAATMASGTVRVFCGGEESIMLQNTQYQKIRFPLSFLFRFFFFEIPYSILLKYSVVLSILQRLSILQCVYLLLYSDDYRLRARECRVGQFDFSDWGDCSVAPRGDALQDTFSPCRIGDRSSLWRRAYSSYSR